MVRDLTGVMPDPAGQAGSELHDLWSRHFLALHRVTAEGQHTSSAMQAEQRLTEAIGQTRSAVLEVLSRLD